MSGRVRLPDPLRARLSELPAGRPDAASPVVVAAVVAALTEPGEVVLDTFAGHGTALAAALRLGRRAVGVELLPERVAALRAAHPAAVVVEGDARQVGALLAGLVDPVGPVDLVLTSPPYRTRHRHPEDPLAGYRRPGGGYDAYLAGLREALRAAAALLRPCGHLVVDVADPVDADGDVTPLVADAEGLLDAVPGLVLVQRVAVEWDEHPPLWEAETLLVARVQPAGAGREEAMPTPGSHAYDVHRARERAHQDADLGVPDGKADVAANEALQGDHRHGPRGEVDNSPKKMPPYDRAEGPKGDRD